ncbi:MAG: hypothetical protein IPK15_15180 [Verrucomicrobia bacterium]|nr:hypothetical protein [Verrucomicrobiota bacterium]
MRNHCSSSRLFGPVFPNLCPVAVADECLQRRAHWMEAGFDLIGEICESVLHVEQGREVEKLHRILLLGRFADGNGFGGARFFGLLKLWRGRGAAVDLVQRGVGLERRPAERRGDQEQDEFEQRQARVQLRQDVRRTGGKAGLDGAVPVSADDD